MAETKEQATGARCLSNQKQPLLTWALYSDDNNDNLLPYSGVYVATQAQPVTLNAGGIWPYNAQVTVTNNGSDRLVDAITAKTALSPLYTCCGAVDAYRHLHFAVAFAGWLS